MAVARDWLLRRVFDSGWMFVNRAGTLILATMILVWACCISPADRSTRGGSRD